MVNHFEEVHMPQVDRSPDYFVAWRQVCTFSNELGQPPPQRKVAEDALRRGLIIHTALLVHPRLLAILFSRLTVYQRCQLQRVRSPSDFRPTGQSFMLDLVM